MRRLLFALTLGVSAQPVGAQHGAADGEWHYWGGDPGSTRYAPLDQIDRDNVGDLEVAWIWHADDFGTTPEYKNEVTPLMVDGVLYFTSGNRRAVIAADAGTGETLWVWQSDHTQLSPVRRNNRGVSYWADGDDKRIVTVTPEYELVALDAKTGRPVPGFGDNGIVNLVRYVEPDANYDPAIGMLMNTSPPAISHDVIVVPTSLANARTPASMRFPKGDIMAFDARTGRKRWTFHTIPRDGETGADTWLEGSNEFTGHAGAWTPFSVDETLGYIYLPVEAATGDQYGGHRPGANLFSSSIVCLDIETGARVWHQQLIHHDIWDWDPPSAPILLDLRVEGRTIPAVVQLTKVSFAYAFDRRNGAPIFALEERPVPQTDAPGEHTSPTQPFPTRPPAFDRQGLSVEDLIDYTPELERLARAAIEGYRIGPLFTPPSLVDPARGRKGTFMFPGSGGANWEGGAVDPVTGYLYVGSATRTDTAVYGLRPPRPGESDMRLVGTESRGPELEGGLPVVKPPWGRITAIDMNRGEILWQVPNGDTPSAIANHPLLRGVELPRTGSPSRAGVLVTSTLLFAGEGYGGQPVLRAYDKSTGEILWEAAIPGGEQTGLPMTYMHRGRQYIVFAAAGNPQTQTPATLIAYSLADSDRSVAAAEAIDYDDLPDWSGTWSRRGGTVFDRGTWTLNGVPTDPSKPGADVSAPGTRAHPPYNEEWEAIYRENLALRDQGLFPDPLTRCIAHGFPRIFNVLGPVEFVVRPEQTWVLAEHTRATMRIYTDGRSHPPPEERWHTYFGDSVGRWDGDKLTFTTVALKGWRDHDSVLDRSGLVLSDQAHATTVMQRVRETNAAGEREELIRVTITLEDPVALTEPWVVVKRFYKDPPGTRIFDYECNEYNRAIVDDDGRSLILDQEGRVIR